jgi:conjugal transfer pilus assembly protein TraW
MGSLLSNCLLATSLVLGGAQDTIIVGQTYPIAEPDTLTEIQERAAKVDWNQWRNQATSKARAFVSANLPLATQEADRLFDPTYTLPRDIADANGKILFAKGTQVNVYRRIRDPKRYIVIADQESHYRWLKEVAKPTDQDLVLLANGNVYEARVRTQLDLYLLDDRFVERFGLERVPSVVQQEGTMLRVHEYAVR